MPSTFPTSHTYSMTWQDRPPAQNKAGHDESTRQELCTFSRSIGSPDGSVDLTMVNGNIQFHHIRQDPIELVRVVKYGYGRVWSDLHDHGHGRPRFGCQLL